MRLCSGRAGRYLSVRGGDPEGGFDSSPPLNVRPALSPSIENRGRDSRRQSTMFRRTQSRPLSSHYLQLSSSPCPPDIAPGRAEEEGLWPLNRSPSAFRQALGSMR